MKAIKWIVLAVVLLVVVVVAVALFRIDSIIRYAVEDRSSTELQVPASLASANLSIMGGSLALNDYKIGSPDGFAAPEMFSVGNLDVNVSFRDLRGDPIRIQRIGIDQPTLVLEYSAQAKKFNFQALMENLSRTPEEPQEAETEPINLVIDELHINGATVALRVADLLQHPAVGALKLDGLNLQDEYRITLPDLVMQGVGSGEGAQNGAAIKDVVAQVVTTMTAKVAESDQLPEPVRIVLSGDLKNAIGQLGPQLQKQVEQRVGQALGELGGRLEGEIGGALRGITGSTTQPGEDPGKAVEQGIQRGLEGILGGERKQERQGEK